MFKFTVLIKEKAKSTLMVYYFQLDVHMMNTSLYRVHWRGFMNCMVNVVHLDYIPNIWNIHF